MKLVVSIILLTYYFHKCICSESEMSDEEYEEKVKSLHANVEILCQNANMGEAECNAFRKIVSQIPMTKESLMNGAKLIPSGNVVKPSDGDEEPSDNDEEPSDGDEEPSDGDEEPSDGDTEPSDSDTEPTDDDDDNDDDGVSHEEL